MNTAFLLMAKYEAQPIIPVETVAKDFFPHLTTDKLVRKLSTGEIPNLPMVRIEAGSQKTAKGVALQHLATYIDTRIEAAAKEATQLAKRISA